MEAAIKGAAKRAGGVAAQAPAGGALGKYGKFPAKGQKRAAGADRRKAFAEALRARVELEVERYGDAAALVDTDRFGATENSTIMRFALQSQARAWAPAGRAGIKRCHRWLLPAKAREGMAAAGIQLTGGVEIWHERNGQSAHYRGLEACKSVWSCPVCSARIMERRTQELQRLVTMHTEAGGLLVHATYTVPHARTHDAKELVECLGASYNALGAGGTYKRWRKANTVGDVRAMEVTWGDANGFHPHYHVLYFLRPGVQVFDGTEDADAERGPDAISVTDLQAFLYRQWVSAATRSGLGEPSEEHGVKVTIAKSQQELLAQYVAKFGREPSKPLWGSEAEMVKGHAKVGSAQRYHPFDFLRAGMLRDHSRNWRKLWADYCDAFKGEQQLRGMTKLAKLYQVETLDDAELFNQAPSEVEFALLTVLSPDEWRVILECGARGVLIDTARRHGFDGVCRLLDVCRSVQREVRAAADRADFEAFKGDEAGAERRWKGDKKKAKARPSPSPKSAPGRARAPARESAAEPRPRASGAPATRGKRPADAVADRPPEALGRGSGRSVAPAQSPPRERKGRGRADPQASLPLPLS